MSNKPIIAVAVATSKQGYGVATSLLESGKYHVRALTKNLNDPRAQKLASKGAELVQTDLLNKGDIKKAFKGAYGVYAMTPITEENQKMGVLQVEAANEERVKQFIWSGLENVDEITGDKIKIPEFTMKANVEEYARNLPNRSFTFTAVYLALFYTNYVEYSSPKKQSDGSLLFTLPVKGDTKLPHQDPFTSPGPVVLAILADPKRYADKVIPVVNEEISPNQIVADFTKVTGIPATFKTASPEEFGENSGIYEFAEKYGYYRKDRELQYSRRINPKVRTWQQFLKDTQWRGESYKEWRKRNDL